MRWIDRCITGLTALAVFALCCLSAFSVAEAGTDIYAVTWGEDGHRTQYDQGQTIPEDANNISFGAFSNSQARVSLKVDGRLTFTGDTENGILELDCEVLRAFGMLTEGRHTIQLLNEAGEKLADATFVIGTPTPTPTLPPTPAPMGKMSVRIDGETFNGSQELNPGRHNINWEVEGAEFYTVDIGDNAGRSYYKAENTQQKDFWINVSSNSDANRLIIRVTAIPKYGSSRDAKSTEVSIPVVIPTPTPFIATTPPVTNGPTPTPAPTPVPIGDIMVKIDGKNIEGGMSLMLGTRHTISWGTEGADYYSVNISDDAKSTYFSAGQTTQESFDLNLPADRNITELSIELSVMPIYGTSQEDAKSIGISIPVVTPTPTPTPTPTLTPTPAPTPVPIGDIVVLIDGKTIEDGTTLMLGTRHTISWPTEGADYYSVNITDDARTPYFSARETTQSTYDLYLPADKNITQLSIELSVMPLYGTSQEDAISISVSIPVVTPTPTPSPTPTSTPTPIPTPTPTPTTTPTPSPTPSPMPLGILAIDIDGESKDFYILDDDPRDYTINWECENFGKYEGNMEGPDGEKITLEKGLRDAFKFTNGDLRKDTEYTFTLRIWPRFGENGDPAVERSVVLVYPARIGAFEVVVNKEPVDVSSPVALKEGRQSITWSAEGAKSYGYSIADDKGNKIISAEEQSEGKAVFDIPGDLKYDINYTMRLFATSAYGLTGSTQLKFICPGPTPTPSPTPSPTPTPTPTPEPPTPAPVVIQSMYSPVYQPLPVSNGSGETYERGRVVSFGSYDWTVLAVENNRALLYCNKPVENMPYSENGRVAWSSSPVRDYLNNTFIKNFSGDEQARILENPYNLMMSDKIFLLSEEDIKNESRGLPEALMKPSEKLWVQVMGGIRNGVEAQFIYMDTDGALRTESDGTKAYGIQPAMWINIEGEDTQIAPLSNQSQPGDIVTFGAYGPDPVEWLVLTSDGSNKVLLSRYLMDAQPYNEVLEPTSWAKSTLRQWLNENFLPRVLSTKQQEALKTATIVNTVGGTTEDRVWILSQKEQELCFQNVSAEAKPISAILKILDEYGGWWTRDVSPEDNKKAVYCDKSSGKVAYWTENVVYLDTSGNLAPRQMGVRPAVCVDTALLK